MDPVGIINVRVAHGYRFLDVNNSETNLKGIYVHLVPYLSIYLSKSQAGVGGGKRVFMADKLISNLVINTKQAGVINQ